MRVQDMQLGEKYTLAGEDRWTVEAIMFEPAVTLKNKKTGEKLTIGEGGLLFRNLKKVEEEEL